MSWAVFTDTNGTVTSDSDSLYVRTGCAYWYQKNSHFWFWQFLRKNRMFCWYQKVSPSCFLQSVDDHEMFSERFFLSVFSVPSGAWGDKGARSGSVCYCFPLFNRLFGLGVKVSASRAEEPWFESRLRRDFSRVESYQWLKNWHSSGYPARRLAL